MVLYLVRHSKAENSHPRGDAHRRLSEKGWTRLAEVADQVKAKDWKPGLRLVSPFTRAQETARGFSEILPFGAHPLLESNLLTPDSDPQEALAELQSWVGEGHPVLWVFTHNPFVTDLAHLLVESSYPYSLSFHTPTVLALSFPQGIVPGSGKVLWTVHPKDFD